MSEQNRPQSLAESISALVDNQASELELQRILKASEQDPSVKAVWARYQMVGSILRGEKVNYSDQSVSEGQSAVPSFDFAARLSAAIANEDQLAVSENRQSQAKHGLWYQLGRVALVASVAGGMVLGVQQFNTSASVESQMAAATNNTVAPAPALPSGINTQAISTRTVAMQSGYESRAQENRRVMFKPHVAATAATPISDEEVTQYVNQMIQAHSDNAVMNSNQGVLPYARVIVTEEE